MNSNFCVVEFEDRAAAVLLAKHVQDCPRIFLGNLKTFRQLARLEHISQPSHVGHHSEPTVTTLFSFEQAAIAAK